MRKNCRTWFLVLLVALPGLQNLWADTREITVVNDTGEDGMYLFVSPQDSSSWGPDLLDSESYLEDGDSHSFMVTFDNDNPTFDIMLVDVDDVTYIKWNASVARKTNTITMKASDAADEFDMELSEVTFLNDTGFEIINLYFSPSDSEVWGPDILRSDVTLEDSDEYTFYVPLDDTMVFNVQAVDEDDDTYSFDIELEPGDEAYYTIDIEDLD